MNVPIKLIPVFLALCSAPLFAADAPKAKVLDKLDSIDPKTNKAIDLKAKAVPTSDPQHRKAMELFGDFSKPNTWPRYEKMFPVGTLNAKKYSGFRFHAKTDNETKMFVHISGEGPGPEGRPLDCTARVTLTNVWTEFVIPFSEFKYYEVKQFKNGEQKIYPGGVPIADVELALIKSFGFGFSIEGRGNDTTAKALVDGLELVEKKNPTE